MVRFHIPHSDLVTGTEAEVTGIGGSAPDLSIQMAGQAELGYVRKENGSLPLLGGLVSDVSGVIRNLSGLACTVDTTLGGTTLTIENPGAGKVITTLGVQARWFKTSGVTGLGAQALTIKRLAADDTEIGSFILDMDDMDPTGADKQRAFNTPTLAVSSTNGGAFENTKVQIGFNGEPQAGEKHYLFYSYAVQDVIV